VMSALERFFYMDRCKAAIVMMEAHVKGVAACGVFSRDVAETVITQASTYAVKHEYPLSFRMEARNTI